MLDYVRQQRQSQRGIYQEIWEGYSEESFFDKILKYAKVIGVNLIFKALQLYYVLQKPDVPAADKGIIIAALGYLISPLDFIPDPIPVAGYTDDALAMAWKSSAHSW